MATRTRKLKATCKICRSTIRRNTRAELIKAMHAHYLKAHPKSLSRRIKKGMRKAREASAESRITIDTAGNRFWNPKWIGFAERPVIEKVTGMKYEDVKSKVLDFFVQMLLGGVSKPS